MNKLLTLTLKGISTTLVLAACLAGSAFSQEEPDVVVDTEGGETTTNPEDTRFTCQIYQGKYTVMYNPESQPGEAYPWAVPSQMGGGWTPEKRCEAISSRLESYRPDGLLELTTGEENGYETICVITEADSSCRIVLTVPPNKNAEVTRDLVFENLTTADSGQQTEGVNTYDSGNGDWLNQAEDLLGIDLPGTLGGNNRSSSNGINLKPYLDAADGGTGTMLNSGTRNNPNPRRLNPDLFR